MNAAQNAKLSALARCRMGPFSAGPRFIRGLLWLREHSPQTELTWRQRWYLDWLIYHYRKQLAGREFGYEIPTSEPHQDDYRPDAKVEPQINLFGELQAVATPASVGPAPAPEPDRQARLL